MSRKYSNEQLSRILSCAANGELGGAGEPDGICVEQAAHASYAGTIGFLGPRWEAYDDRFRFGLRAGSRPGAVTILRWLESKGWA